MRIRTGKDSKVSERPDPVDGESLTDDGGPAPVDVMESSTTDSVQPTPPLLRDRSFLGMMATQFLGAFNDNLFKQLMLLLAIPVAAAASDEKEQQWVATVVFALPFILFSGYAGFLSDRFSKRQIIVLSKLAEVGVMALGLLAFLQFQVLGNTGLLVVLFLMATQSAFFGPGKYGILPEMLPKKHLPRANGMILMTTFLAIIFGTAFAGFLGKSLIDDKAIPELREVGLWRASCVCIGIATAGVLTSLLVRRIPAAKPNLKLQLNSLVVSADTLRLLAADRGLLGALFASCVFWLVSGITILAVNAFGMALLDNDMFLTSIMTAVIGLGIALGALVAGRLSQGKIDFRIARCGVWGLVFFLALLSVSRSDGVHLLGFSGSLIALTLLGMSAGFFAIPVQVLIQERPPKGQKGRMIAAMNFFNFIAILFSGVLYEIFNQVRDSQGWPRSTIFAMIAGIVLPLAIFYRPKNESANR